MTFLLTMHIVGISLGLGGATIGAFLFFKSVADRRIDLSEYRAIVTASRTTFFGMFLLYTTGAGFLIMGAEPTDSFWAKMVIVAIVTVAESVTLAFFLPLLRRCVDRDINLASSEFTDYLPLVASISAISLLSWYSAMFLGVIRETQLPFAVLVGIYGCMLVFSLIAANIAAWWVMQIKKHSHQQRHQKVQSENAYFEHAMQMSSSGSREVLKGVQFDDAMPKVRMGAPSASSRQDVLKGVEFDDLHPELDLVLQNGLSHSLKGVDYSDEHPALEIDFPPEPNYAR